ncbi:calponin domain-containing protein [Aspergillus arachidicola]|uniref:Calponin domain-containing protein n=1 Tax=Aspergillus arachidicola TaxID=656916 RepID=A0A2G7FR88_9EURO|nr:calponin domain-containing protein [Aspergillus arachidicola]
MASVTSLDKDLRSLRLSRYTPQAAAEVRSWIEEVLHERLPAGDLLDALKDGVALCRLVNLAVSPGVKYKQSSMPFVQMENISHFLRACQIPPLSLPPHDVFLTVDLYEAKDPAQVLQCLVAFSRRANALQPGKFPRSIGPQSKVGALSPNATGSSQGAHTPSRPRGLSNANSSASGYSSPAKSPGPVSSWSKRTDEHTTMPAWNIHQYGYMGGASQANQGVAFGARRQITTAAPNVPSLAEKEKRRREEEERQRLEFEESERRRQEREAEEARARSEEERRWEEETARLKEQQRRKLEEERKQWNDQQRRWEEEEEQRQREEREAEERLEKERLRRREVNDTRLNGQFLSQYQASQAGPNQAPAESSESRRIRELERELETAKQREAEYQRERQEIQEKQAAPAATPAPRPVPVPPKPSYDLSSLDGQPPPSLPPRPLPEPLATSPRPLPDPTLYTSKPMNQESRVDRFLASNRPPVAPKPATHLPQDYTTTAEVDAENSRRAAAQQKTKAGGWASKSLLEREMERERERQREWEENQKQTQQAAAKGMKDSNLGVGPGQGAWDVHQYGFMGGDNQNRGGHGLGVGGARRQIIGPRPPP